MKKLELFAPTNFPLINEGDNIANIIENTIKSNNIKIEDGDVIVLAQKIISKAEGNTVDLKEIIPSKEAIEISNSTGRDPRLCQVYLDESSEIKEIKGRMVITRHRLGYVMSSSGVDKSNIAPHEEGKVVLLPKDPDLSCRIISDILVKTFKKRVAIIINDSCGRADRGGSVGTAIGVGYIDPILSQEKEDLFGNKSKSQIAVVDELAAAASLMMGQDNEGIPMVYIKGASYTGGQYSQN